MPALSGRVSWVRLNPSTTSICQRYSPTFSLPSPFPSCLPPSGIRDNDDGNDDEVVLLMMAPLAD